MNKEAERDDERRFELFFEYLKRNEKYKKFTQWVKNNFDEERFNLSEINKCPYVYEDYLCHWVIFGRPSGKKSYTDYKKQKPFRCAREINLSHEIDAIEKWYDEIFIKPFKKLQGDRVASIIKENLCFPPEDIYIKVDINSDYSLKEITEEVKDIVKKEKEKRKLQDVRKRKAGLDELQRYLIVYDTRETMINGKKTRWESVHEQMNPSGPYTEEKRLQLLSDYRKAKLIINNSIECHDPRDFPK